MIGPIGAPVGTPRHKRTPVAHVPDTAQVVGLAAPGLLLWAWVLAIILKPWFSATSNCLELGVPVVFIFFCGIVFALAFAFGVGVLYLPWTGRARAFVSFTNLSALMLCLVLPILSLGLGSEDLSEPPPPLVDTSVTSGSG